MSKDGAEWRERESYLSPPISPYVYQGWKCRCGNSRVSSYDFRYPQMVDIHKDLKIDKYGLKRYDDQGPVPKREDTG